MRFNMMSFVRSIGRGSTRKRRQGKNPRLSIERLEDRRLLAVYTVNSPLDFDDGSAATLTLREALTMANQHINHDTIVFDFQGNTTIELEKVTTTPGGDVGTPLDIKSHLDIVGNGMFEITIAPGDDLERRAFIVHNHGHGGQEGESPKVTISGIGIEGFSTAENYVDPDKPNIEHGPAISNWGNLTLENVYVHNNSTIHNAGAIYNAATLNVDSSIFFSNTATLGGAFYTHDIAQIDGDSRLIVSNTLFQNNVATESGGAIYNHNHVGANKFRELDATAVLSVSNSMFRSNHADFGNGGAIYSERAGILVARSEFVENTALSQAQSRGGAIYSNSANSSSNNFMPETIVVDSTFDRNVAERGGAVYFYFTDIVEIVNSTFSANHAQTQGGALFFLKVFESAIVTNSTITKNTVGFQGAGVAGGVYSPQVPQSVSPMFFNTIISNNRGVGDVPSNYWGTFDSLSDYNLVGSPDPTQSNPGLRINHFVDDVDDTPGLDPLADNGGPTRTHAFSAMHPSEAINAGDPFAMFRIHPRTPDFDQRGFSRIEDTRIDIGAYELQVVMSPQGVHDATHEITNFSGLIGEATEIRHDRNHDEPGQLLGLSGATVENPTLITEPRFQALDRTLLPSQSMHNDLLAEEIVNDLELAISHDTLR